MSGLLLNCILEIIFAQTAEKQLPLATTFPTLLFRDYLCLSNYHDSLDQ